MSANPGYKFPKSENLGIVAEKDGVAYSAHFYGENEGAAVISIPDPQPTAPGMTLRREVYRGDAGNSDEARAKSLAWLEAKGII